MIKRLQQLALVALLVCAGAMLHELVDTARAGTQPPQSLLNNASVGAGLTVCTATYTPHIGHQGFAFFTFADQAGSVQLRRIDPLANQRTRPSVTITASTEDVEYVLQPWPAAQLCYTNSSGVTAHVWVDANDQGGQPRS